MKTNTHTTAEAALLNKSRTQDAFDAANSSIKVYGALSAVVLLAVIAAAISGHVVNTFMWVRAVLLPVLAMRIYQMTRSASRGSRRAFGYVRALAVIMPITITGIDLIPGVCPPWYAVIQILSTLPMIRLAFLTGSSTPHSTPKKRRPGVTSENVTESKPAGADTAMPAGEGGPGTGWLTRSR